MSTVLEKAWAELDGTVDQIAISEGLKKQADADRNLERSEFYALQLVKLKHFARGEAQIISLFMSAYYPTMEAVSLEAAKRRAHRIHGFRYESPGLGARRFQKEVKDVTDTREG